MDHRPRRSGDARGGLAASLIGSLGGLFAGASLLTFRPDPAGFEVDAVFFGFLVGALTGAIVGALLGMGVAVRRGNGIGAAVGGAAGIVAAFVLGRFSFDFAFILEGMFQDRAPVAGILGGVFFAALAGAFVGLFRNVTPTPSSARPVTRSIHVDLLAGGLAGAFFGLLAGALTEVVTVAWSEIPPPSATAGSNIGLFLGFYLGSGVGAAIAALVGAIVRRLSHARISSNA